MPGTARWVGSVVLVIGAAACMQEVRPPGAAGGEGVEGVRAEVPPPSQATRPDSDTLRGTVEVVGADPTTSVLLRGARGAVLDDPGAAGRTPQEDPEEFPGGNASGAGVVLLGHGDILRQLVGLEVKVGGVLGPPGPSPASPGEARSFQVASAVVRSDAGRRAVDGVLTRVRDHWVIEDMDEVHHILPDLPAALHGMEGMRVWVSLGPDGSPQGSGVIR